mgnify:CR=1 FL=1
MFSCVICIYTPSNPNILIFLAPETPSEKLTSTVALVSKDSERLQQAAFSSSPVEIVCKFIGLIVENLVVVCFPLIST